MLAAPVRYEAGAGPAGGEPDSLGEHALGLGWGTPLNENRAQIDSTGDAAIVERDRLSEPP